MVEQVSRFDGFYAICTDLGDDAPSVIKAHFLTCFLALILCKYLEKKINRGLDHFTTERIIDQLREMNMLSVESEGYVPTYERTGITNALHGTAVFRTDMQIVTKKSMRHIIPSTKHKDDE